MPTAEKDCLHPRNPHRQRYDFQKLAECYPALKAFIKINPYKNETIDFANPKAVKALNKALLKFFYKIEFWDIPEGCLCPPIPGRADYIHTIADLLSESNQGEIPRGRKVTALDIGVGANCVYPIIGCHEYGWSFVGTELNNRFIESARLITTANPTLTKLVELRLQVNPAFIFKGVITTADRFDITLCNPPFHASPEEAQKGTLRKLRNLGTKKGKETVLNFGGQGSELWCEGGEKAFINSLVQESVTFASQCLWFTTLVSKKTNLPSLLQALKQSGVNEVKTLQLAQGQKVSRIAAWTFMNKKERESWRKDRW